MGLFGRQKKKRRQESDLLTWNNAGNIQKQKTSEDMFSEAQRIMEDSSLNKYGKAFRLSGCVYYDKNPYAEKMMNSLAEDPDVIHEFQIERDKTKKAIEQGVRINYRDMIFEMNQIGMCR